MLAMKIIRQVRSKNYVLRAPIRSHRPNMIGLLREAKTISHLSHTIESTSMQYQSLIGILSKCRWWIPIENRVNLLGLKHPRRLKMQIEHIKSRVLLRSSPQILQEMVLATVLKSQSLCKCWEMKSLWARSQFLCKSSTTMSKISKKYRTK